MVEQTHQRQPPTLEYPRRKPGEVSHEEVIEQKSVKERH